MSSLQLLLTTFSTVASHVHVSWLAPGAPHQPAAVVEYQVPDLLDRSTKGASAERSGRARRHAAARRFELWRRHILWMTGQAQQTHGSFIHRLHVQPPFQWPKASVTFSTPTAVSLVQSRGDSYSPHEQMYLPGVQGRSDIQSIPSGMQMLHLL